LRRRRRRRIVALASTAEKRTVSERLGDLRSSLVLQVASRTTAVFMIDDCSGCTAGTRTCRCVDQKLTQELGDLQLEDTRQFWPAIGAN
jgi:hypothetical protein